jgi:hypothetical protein
VLEGAESVGEPAGPFDDQVDGLSAAVADLVGGECGQDVDMSRGSKNPGAAEAIERAMRIGRSPKTGP